MKKIKTIIINILILTLLLSCKGKITNIKLTPIENDKKWDYYYISSRHISSNNKESLDTVFVSKPITFRLENNTNRDLQINYVIENFLFHSDAIVIVNNKSYQYETYKINLKKTTDITVFTHLKIPMSVIDKEYLDKLSTTGNKIKNDSIILGKINPKLQSAIDSSFKKKYLIIKLLNKNNENEYISVYYCAYRQKTFVFDSDSLSKANPRYKPDCN